MCVVDFRQKEVNIFPSILWQNRTIKIILSVTWESTYKIAEDSRIWNRGLQNKCKSRKVNKRYVFPFRRINLKENIVQWKIMPVIILKKKSVYCSCQKIAVLSWSQKGGDTKKMLWILYLRKHIFIIWKE